MSNATARCAAADGSLSFLAQRSLGRLMPPGRLNDSSIQRSSSARTPAPVRRVSLASAMNLPATTRCSSEGYNSSTMLAQRPAVRLQHRCLAPPVIFAAHDPRISRWSSHRPPSERVPARDASRCGIEHTSAFHRPESASSDAQQSEQNPMLRRCLMPEQYLRAPPLALCHCQPPCQRNGNRVCQQRRTSYLRIGRAKRTEHGPSKIDSSSRISFGAR